MASSAVGNMVGNSVAKGSSRRKDRPRTEVVVAAITETEVRVLQATRQGGNLVIQHRGAADGAPDEEGQARALVQALQQAGISERRVVLSLPARSVVIKRVHLPPASPEQLPQLVAYEAQRHLPLPLDQLATGFEEIPRTAGDDRSGTEVLLGVARKSDLTRLERALAAAGVQVEEYGVEALGITDAYLAGAATLHNGDAWLLLASEDSGLHAQILREGRLLFNRYLPLNGGGWQADLRRSLAAFSMEHPEAPIEDVVLLGKADEELLSQTVGQTVRRAEVRATQGGEALAPAWTPLVGLARQWLGAGQYPLRISPQGWEEGKRAGGRSQVVIGALAVLALAAAFVVWQFDHQKTMTTEAEQAARLARQAGQDRRVLDSLLQKRERLREQLTAMGGQVGDEPDAPPLELLRQVTESAPPGVWLTQVNYSGGKPLQLQGSTRNAAQVNRFMNSLEHIPGFQRVEMGYVRSGTVDNTPVTQFEITCALTAGKQAVTTASARRERTR